MSLRIVCVDFVLRKICELLLIKDMSCVPNVLWFEYTSLRMETRCLVMSSYVMMGDGLCLFSTIPGFSNTGRECVSSPNKLN